MDRCPSRSSLAWGGLFSWFHERLRAAHQQAGRALEQLREARDLLERQVTERTNELHRANATQRESEREFRTLAEAMPQIVWMCLPDGRNIYFNPRWMEYTGLSLEESLGTGWNKPFHPEDRQRAWDAWNRAIATGGTYDLEGRLRRADGAYRWFIIRGVPLRGAEGGILKWFGTCTDIDDRKQAEEALRTSERRLNFALEMSQIGGWEIDLVDHTAHRTPEHARIFGYAALDEQWTFERFVEHVVPEDRPEVARRVQRAIARRGSWNLECRIRRADGALRWIYAAGTCQGDASGEPRRAAGIIQDITERRQAMEELLASRAKLEAALASMADAVFLSDNEGHFLHFNEAFATFHRFKNKDECARTLAEYPAFLEVFLPSGELAPLELWAVPRALRGETATNAEYTLRRKDTGQTWVGSYNFAPIRDAEGKIVGSVVVGRDVTDLKRLELERETALAKYRTLFDCFPLGITVADRQGLIVETNRLAEGILGLPTQEMRTRKLGGAEWTVLRADGSRMPPEEYPSLRALREQRLIANVEMQIVAAAETKWLSVTAAPLPLEDFGVVVAYGDITANKRDQQALRTSQEHRALALDAARAGTWEWEMTTGRVLWSEELWAVYGLAPHSCEPTYEAWRRTVHPEDVESLETTLRGAVSAGEELALEWRVGEPHGRTRWLMSRGRPHRDESGRVARYHGVVIDITDRKLAEERLRENELRLRLAVQAANIGLWDWDLTRNTVYYSPEWKGQLGCTEEEISQNLQEWQDRVHPQDLESALQQVRSYLAKPEGRHEVEMRMRHKDGSYRWIYAAADVLRDASGRPVRMLGCHLDITERKQAVEALRRQTERLRWLYGLSRSIVQAGATSEGVVGVALRHLIELIHCRPAVVGVFDAAGGKADLYVGDREGEMAVRTVPLPPEVEGEEWEVLRQGRVEVVPDSHDGSRTQAVGRALRTQGVRSYIGVPLVAQQRVAGALLVGWPEPRVLPAEEVEIAIEVAGWVTIALEQVRLLREVTRHAETLEGRVRERTAQLEAANRELEAFSYSVSHDLRAPLRHVHGYVDMLRREVDGQLSEKGRRYLRTIADASKDMGTLIDDLLAFSRLGKAELHEAWVDLNPLVVEVRRSLEEAHSGRRIQWRITALPTVRGDAAMLRQVLANLLGNAVKYTGPRDPAEIEVGCAGVEGDRAVLFVRDNGVGFDPAYTHKLFRVFQRLHRADEFEGTGIGLAIVSRIVTRHGGRTWAEGAVGRGAAFFFTLAAEPAPAAPAAAGGKEP